MPHTFYALGYIAPTAEGAMSAMVKTAEMFDPTIEVYTLRSRG